MRKMFCTRSCSRCGLPLEDPASEEMGVGPICNKKTAALAAKAIPANYAMAEAIAMAIHAELKTMDEQLIHHIAERICKIREIISVKAETMSRNFETDFLHKSGADLRSVIKEIDFILSHKLPLKTRALFVNLVKFLGYRELAGVYSLNASTSEAKLAFDSQTGIISLSGKYTKHGYISIRQIKGCVVPRRGASDLYTAPAISAAAFLEAVANFWPMYVIESGGSLAELQQQAEEWQTRYAAPPVPVAAPPAPAPAVPVAVTSALPASAVASMRYLENYRYLRGGVIQCHFPWQREKNKQMLSLVQKLKEIPARDRFYDAERKTWFFLLHHKEHVTAAVTELFNIKEN